MAGGSKSIDRVGRIMRVLERGPEEGMTTSEIAAEIGADRATTHRAIVSLERIGFVDKDPGSRSVRLGIYMFSLGAKTARRFSVLNHAREVAVRLAEQTGDTVSLNVRNKYDCVCIDRRSGNFPIKAQTVSVGDSLPLGVSTAGLAILATMNDDDVRHAIQYNAAKISEFHLVKPNEILQHVRQTRQRGYAIYFGHIIAGLAAVGFAIKDAHGRALASISVSGILDRFTDERIQFIANTVSASVSEIEKRAAMISEVEFGDH